MAALGSDVRRAILKLLMEQDLSVNDIAAQFPISRPAISKHLKLLSKAGLVTHDVQGVRSLYRLNTDGFTAGHDWLNAFWPDALNRFKLLAENTYEGDPDA